ncbi:hypothetical protein BGZ98_004413, partial [Dissophora globulifera]
IPEFSAKMRELFPKQRTKFVDAVVSADHSVFGNKAETTGTGPGSEETDLDHEEDSNILGRLERELRRFETEEKEQHTASQHEPPIASTSTRS